MPNKEEYVPNKKEMAAPDPKSYFSLNTIFKEPIYCMMYRIKGRSFFKWPPKLGGDTERRGQQTTVQLPPRLGAYDKRLVHKKFLDEMVANGHLKEFIEDENASPEKVEELDSRTRSKRCHTDDTWACNSIYHVRSKAHETTG